MRILSTALAIALLALPGHAAETILPGLADVTGVAANDVLNIRAAPNAKSAIIGSFAPDAAGIEVVATQDGWLRITTPEASGWISARYATLRPGLWQPGALPPGLACHGTEPFWGLTLDGNAARLTRPEAAQRHEGLRILQPAGAGPSAHRALVAEGLVAIVAPAPALCSDGMSDALFGLDVNVVLGEGAEASYLHGCCSIGR